MIANIAFVLFLLTISTSLLPVNSYRRAKKVRAS